MHLKEIECIRQSKKLYFFILQILCFEYKYYFSRIEELIKKIEEHSVNLINAASEYFPLINKNKADDFNISFHGL